MLGEDLLLVRETVRTSQHLLEAAEKIGTTIAAAMAARPSN